MKITVKTMSGTMYHFNLEDTDKIEALKKKVQQKVALTPDQQRLVYKGKILPDDKTPNECGVQAGETIQLILAL
jgi:hypothetical protein